MAHMPSAAGSFEPNCGTVRLEAEARGPGQRTARFEREYGLNYFTLPVAVHSQPRQMIWAMASFWSDFTS